MISLSSIACLVRSDELIGHGNGHSLITYRGSTGLRGNLFLQTIQGPEDAASLLHVLYRKPL